MKLRLALALAALLAAVVTLGAARADDKPRPRSAGKSQKSPDGGAVIVVGDGGAPEGRAVRVRLNDGSTVAGTVHAEEAQMLVIDCSLGMLSIPRARISTIAYDAAAGVGQKRAPIQMLDDDGPPPKTHPANP
jgi:hypothetical protein